jgi:hypothetical protein
VLEGSTVVITWNPVASKVPLAGYLVYRAQAGDPAGAPLTAAPINDTIWRDRTAKPGGEYVYWIVAQTVEGKLGSASARQSVSIPKSGGAVPFF